MVKLQNLWVFMVKLEPLLFWVGVFSWRGWPEVAGISRKSGGSLSKGGMVGENELF